MTSTRDGEAHTGRMPSADTGHLTKTTVSLTGEAGDAPTRHHTLRAVSLRRTEDIDNLILERKDTDETRSTFSTSVANNNSQQNLEIRQQPQFMFHFVLRS